LTDLSQFSEIKMQNPSLGDMVYVYQILSGGWRLH